MSLLDEDCMAGGGDDWSFFFLGKLFILFLVVEQSPFIHISPFDWNNFSTRFFLVCVRVVVMSVGKDKQQTTTLYIYTIHKQSHAKQIYPSLFH